jgi:pimeloyl-ACP methyl ester carboxylesterase
LFFVYINVVFGENTQVLGKYSHQPGSRAGRTLLGHLFIYQLKKMAKLNPLTSLEDDVAATKVLLDNQDGPTVLVGHSWGGAVITEARNHPKVESLVYVC